MLAVLTSPLRYSATLVDPPQPRLIRITIPHKAIVHDWSVAGSLAALQGGLGVPDSPLVPAAPAKAAPTISPPGTSGTGSQSKNQHWGQRKKRGPST